MHTPFHDRFTLAGITIPRGDIFWNTLRRLHKQVPFHGHITGVCTFLVEKTIFPFYTTGGLLGSSTTYINPTSTPLRPLACNSRSKRGILCFLGGKTFFFFTDRGGYSKHLICSSTTKGGDRFLSPNSCGFITAAVVLFRERMMEIIIPHTHFIKGCGPANRTIC